MYQLVIQLKDFSAAHRLVKGYQGKCNHLHGHNYTLKISIRSEVLSNDDLLIDFAVVRQLCDEWVQAKLDHATLIYQADKSLYDFLIQQQQKHRVLAENTTVECLAKEIYRHLAKIIDNESITRGIKFHLQQVELWESKGCGVIYCEEN